MRPHLIPTAILAALFLIASAAAADDKGEAKAHFEKGKALQKSQEVEAAAAEYERSVSYYASKNNLYNLANCYRALGRLEEALATFGRIMNEFGDKLGEEMKKDIEVQTAEIQILAALTAEAEENPSSVLEAPAAELTIISNEPGAEVKVDGEPKGITPLDAPIALKQGTHTVSITKAGFEPQERSEHLDAGEKRSVELNLTPKEVTPVAGQKAPPERGAPLTAPAEKRRGRLTPLFIAGLAGTVAMTGVAAAMWGAAGKNASDHDEKVNKLKTLSKDGGWNNDIEKQAEDDKRDTEIFNKAAVGTTIAAGACAVLMVTGLVLKKKERERPKAALSPIPGGLRVSF
jgi:tetratricopeptide (TPR) repeat protein